MNELRDYGRRLGIRGIWRKNKAELQEHLFNVIHEEVNERILRRPNMDPERALWKLSCLCDQRSLQDKKRGTVSGKQRELIIYR